MTKEEKIQQLITDLTTESVRWPRMKTTDVVDMLKIIQAIETNNGWIKIEREDDLPKSNDKYWIIDKSKDIEMLKFDSKDDGYMIIWKSQFTHYQPIVKPEPPIY